MTSNGLSCDCSDDIPTDVILCDGKASMDAHRELFRLRPEQYVICEFPPLEYLQNLQPLPKRLQLALLWQGVLEIALWKNKISMSKVIYILKDMGVNRADVKHLRIGEVADIFPFLCYGRYFELLRKICTLAKKTAEERLQQKGFTIDCHLVSEDSQRIVASSL